MMTTEPIRAPGSLNGISFTWFPAAAPNWKCKTVRRSMWPWSQPKAAAPAGTSAPARISQPVPPTTTDTPLLRAAATGVRKAQAIPSILTTPTAESAPARPARAQARAHRALAWACLYQRNGPAKRTCVSPDLPEQESIRAAEPFRLPFPCPLTTGETDHAES